MTRLHTNAALTVLLTLCALAAPVVATAQGRSRTARLVPDTPGPAARTFGTTSSTSHTMQAFAFTGFSAADSARFDANLSGSRFCTTAPCAFEAALLLPAGAAVTAVEVEACDGNGAAEVRATLFRQTPAESSFVDIGAVSTGGVATPACGFFLSSLPIAETVDNYNNTYQVEVVIDGAGEATRFQAVRIFYNLQVSPSPTHATFLDVPVSHPFFQFISALQASGITTGCSASPPLYCPDDPVTRGQMAVFLSKALGLHFAP